MERLEKFDKAAYNLQKYNPEDVFSQFYLIYAMFHKDCYMNMLSKDKNQSLKTLNHSHVEHRLSEDELKKRKILKDRYWKAMRQSCIAFFA